MKNQQKTWYKKLVVTALSVSIGLSVLQQVHQVKRKQLSRHLQK